VIDLLVVGGGPVGLAAAIHARIAGLTVMVAEPREDPIDKACGEGLMPSAVNDLAELGVRPEGRRFVGIRYLRAPHEAEARFRNGAGLGVRRTTLHGALAARADELGVVRERMRVTDVRQHETAVEAAGVTARWLVGADGLHSSVRRHLGLDRPPAPRAVRFGYRRHFDIAPWSDFVEVHWSRSAEAYVTPVSESTVGVAMLGGSGLDYDEALRHFPQLVERLRAASYGKVRAAGPLRQGAAVRRRGRVLLVGDAAGYVDALTGEGIATGLATARAAVRCILADRPGDYDAAWNAATRRYRTMTGLLLSASQRPLLRKQIVPAAERLPRVFGRVVNLLA
jgi:flavin-dependent dehydrogenase